MPLPTTRADGCGRGATGRGPPSCAGPFDLDVLACPRCGHRMRSPGPRWSLQPPRPVPLYRMIEGRGSEWLTTGCLSGMQTCPLVLEQPLRQKVLGVRLQPAGAYALLAAPLREVSGLVLDLEDILGRAARELIGRCQNAATVEECFRVATRWVGDRIQTARGTTPEVSWSAA